MSFAGHVADMIARIKYNRSLLLSRRENYARLKETILKHHVKKNFDLHKNELDKAGLQKLREKIKKSIRRERMVQNFKVIAVSLLIFLIIILITVKFEVIADFLLRIK